MLFHKSIDGGRGFDWGKTSIDYAKYRDIYPDIFYQKIQELGLCNSGQIVLDIGTGTGVLPRHLYRYGAKFIGIDISENQIEQARLLSEQAGDSIDYQCCPAEKMIFDENSFDVVTASQCFSYFDHETLAPKLRSFLKPGGKFAVFYMGWLPFEDRIAKATEDLILKYNPYWTGGRETRHPINVPSVYESFFSLEHQELFDVRIPFNLESWNGRIKACRGVGASLSEEKIREFEREHLNLLSKIGMNDFTILHFISMAILKVKK